MAQRPISPPPLKRRKVQDDGCGDTLRIPVASQATGYLQGDDECLVASPIRLMRIYGLPQESNADTVTLDSIFSDGPFRSVWHFNFLFDLDFVMSAFDERDRAKTPVHIVHGSWRAEDGNRQGLEEAVKRYSNVRLVTAYMPEPFGTHHSKMMIMFREDDTAQVVIHTANMIPFDWNNMSQGAWISPRLSKMAVSQETSDEPMQLGSGKRFKCDLIRYLSAYESKRTGGLVSELSLYDFSAVRAALIASVPSKASVNSTEQPCHTSWGSKGLAEVVKTLPLRSDDGKSSHVVAQVSSIASLGRPSNWLPDLISILHGHKSLDLKNRTSVIFPSPQEIRSSLNGYLSGSSIHMKIQSEEQEKQVEILRPMLYHWSNKIAAYKACRDTAAPHIKTYIRFTDSKLDQIEYALLTSANLSQQAWGVPTKDGYFRISSYEIGVLVWPELFDDSGKGQQNSKEKQSRSVMVPTFGRDTPVTKALDTIPEQARIIGLRMPYSLPLRKYDTSEMPWSPSATYIEADIHGRYHAPKQDRKI